MRNAGKRLTPLVLGLLGLALWRGLPLVPARAQLLDALFPEGVPGYATEQGVTVRSRARPEYDPLGVHLDTMLLHPYLSEAFGYDDNIFAAAKQRGAWTVATQPALLATASDSNGDAGFYASANDTRYLGAPSQNRTDGNAFLGISRDLGLDRLTIGGGYLAQHEDRSALDALPSDRPVAFTVANARAAYDRRFGRFTVTPAFDLARWRFADTTIFGIPISEASRDRTTVQPSVTLRYDWMPARGLLWVTRVLATHYDQPAAGVPSNNSTAWQSLLGVDYDDNTVWRWRLLGGIEYRAAAAAAVASRTDGIAEAEVTWFPSGMTTVRADLVRGIEDAAQTGLVSYTYTAARLTVDHEYLRDVLLNASATLRQASFQTGGQQVGAVFGAGVSWLINRELRLSLTNDFTDVRDSHLASGAVAGNYDRDLTLLTLRFGW